MKQIVHVFKLNEDQQANGKCCLFGGRRRKGRKIPRVSSERAGGWRVWPRDQVTMISLHHGRNYTWEIYCDTGGWRFDRVGAGGAAG